MPDLLRWARGILSGKLVSGKWAADMLAPVATRADVGRNRDGDDYTAGVILSRSTGTYIRNEGSQKEPTLRYLLSREEPGIAIASTLEFAPGGRYRHGSTSWLPARSGRCVLYRERLDEPIDGDRQRVPVCGCISNSTTNRYLNEGLADAFAT